MGLVERIDRLLARLQFGVEARKTFYDVLADFTQRGHSQEVAIQGMWQRMERKRDSRRRMFLDILVALKEGKPFSEAIAPFIPPAERLMIVSGELIGKYEAGFRQASRVASGVAEMRGAVRKQLAYPVMLTALGIIALWIMSVFVVPELQRVAADVGQWPRVSRIMYYVAQGARQYSIPITVALVLLAVVVRRSLDRWVAPVRYRVFDRAIPPYTMYRAYQGATFLLAFGALTSAGRPVSESLRDVANVSAAWLRTHIDRMIAASDEGRSAGRAVDTGLLDPDTVGLIEDYSRAGSFDQAIVAMGETAIKHGIRRIDRTGSAIRIVMLVVVVFLILLLYFGPAQLAMDLYQKAQAGTRP